MSKGSVQRLPAIATSKTCATCGRNFTDAEGFLTDGRNCLPCWSRKAQSSTAQQHHDTWSELEERLRIGNTLLNDRAIDYPAGLDHRLTYVLDSLRRYVLKVRITLVSDQYDEATPRLLEGHLRRFGPLDFEDDEFNLNQSVLSLFRNADDRDPRDAVDESYYARISRVELIDPLLLGGGAPLTFWVASQETIDRYTTLRQNSLAREHRLAKWFMAHLVAILVVWLLLCIPLAVKLSEGDRLKAIEWIVATGVVAFFVGITLVFWDSTPDLSVLRRTKRDELAAQNGSVVTTTNPVIPEQNHSHNPRKAGLVSSRQRAS